MNTEYLKALCGGVLIGSASVLMLLFNGEILGISGIAGGLFKKGAAIDPWRFVFVAGLLCGGVLVLAAVPGAFDFGLARSPLALIAAGLLVGYGTRLGGGCTSGHGICGVGRLSPRSLLATAVFMALGVSVVFVINHLLGGRI